MIEIFVRHEDVFLLLVEDLERETWPLLLASPQ